MMSANPLLVEEETGAILYRFNSYPVYEVSSNYMGSLYEDVSEGEYIDKMRLSKKLITWNVNILIRVTKPVPALMTLWE